MRAQKKIPETDAIFGQLAAVPVRGAADPATPRVSLDGKTAVKLGPLSRGGSSRVDVKAADHDFRPTGVIVPYGLFLPTAGELFLYFTPGPVTADFTADVLERWWDSQKARHPAVRRLQLDLDNGPQVRSHCGQWRHRLMGFARRSGLELELAYYPPYHSKYNPIERCWGVLENYWGGTLLETEEQVLGMARRMTFRGQHPVVERLENHHPPVKRWQGKARRELEQGIERRAELGDWFVRIPRRDAGLPIP